MELLAVIVGLEAIKEPGYEVTVYSDSRYVVDAIEKKWLWGWVKKGFAKVKNPDLWQRLLKVYTKHKVRFVWVKGHAGNPENERCDQLAVQAASNRQLFMIDEGYEAGEE
jgi:ribonuclease HI